MVFETFFVRIVFLSVDVWFYLRHPKHAVRFRRKVGLWPRLSLPRYYQEKMLWRRIVDRNPLFSVLSDKLAVKDWAAKISPTTPAPKTFWAGQNLEELQEFPRSERWSRKFGPVVKVDRMKKVMIQNEETKEPFA